MQRVSIMNFEELLEKYQAVLTENNNLKIEINKLKAQLGIVEQHYVKDRVSIGTHHKIW